MHAIKQPSLLIIPLTNIYRVPITSSAQLKIQAINTARYCINKFPI